MESNAGRNADRRKLVVGSFVSLDGVMQAPGGPEEDPSGGFEHGGWTAGYWDEAMQARMGEWMSHPADLVLGRKTYEIFAAHWPFNRDQPGADHLNNATKHVASRTLTELEWENSRLIEGDAADGVRALKQQDGPELQVHGSGELIQTLLANDLVDEFRLMIFPVVLGKGKRLFANGAHPDGLELLDSQVSGSGVVIATYRPGVEIKSGSLAAETPSEAELRRRAALED